MEEALERNLIQKPSLEDGPQDDGLPGWPYPFDDPEVRDRSVFYVDDVSIKPITPVPVRLETPVDEICVGESLRWQTSTAQKAGRLAVLLRQGNDVVDTTVVDDPGQEEQSVFATLQLAPGAYRLRAAAEGGAETQTAWRDVIVAPDPLAS